MLERKETHLIDKEEECVFYKLVKINVKRFREREAEDDRKFLRERGKKRGRG